MPLAKVTGADIDYPPAPQGRTIYAVGDIHGRLDLLREVHKKIDEDKKTLRATAVSEMYLGDYIDRGPNGAEVVSHLIARARGCQAFFLRGNHEQMLLNFINGDDCLGDWRKIGGAPTLLSYGLKTEQVARDVPEETVRAEFMRRLPSEHQRFYAETSSYCDAEPYLFVHAGLRPSVALEQQSLMDLLTIRTQFLEFAGDLGRIVVHGHTPVMQPELRPNRINLDTGAFATHLLTCLKVDERGARILGA